MRPWPNDIYLFYKQIWLSSFVHLYFLITNSSKPIKMLDLHCPLYKAVCWLSFLVLHFKTSYFIFFQGGPTQPPGKKCNIYVFSIWSKNKNALSCILIDIKLFVKSLCKNSQLVAFLQREWNYLKKGAWITANWGEVILIDKTTLDEIKSAKERSRRISRHRVRLKTTRRITRRTDSEVCLTWSRTDYLSLAQKRAINQTEPRL